MNQAIAHHRVPDAILPPASPTATELFDGKLSWSMPDAHGLKRELTVRYRLHGPANAPLVVALGGISANRQVQCWWRQLYGAGRCLDPARVRILGMDWLDDQAGISTVDQAGALAAVLEELALPRIDVLIGASYGAMVGLAFAAHHGASLARLVAISGADRSRPFNTALRHIQREIVRLGVECGQRRRGLALARALALTTYRPQALFDQRFGADVPDHSLAEIKSYLDHVGRCFSDNFDADRYSCLSDSLDHHVVDPDRIDCCVDLVAVDSDTLVTVDQIEALAQRLNRRVGRPLQARGRVHRLSSAYGHDAFLKEPAAFNRLLGELIDTEVGA